MTNLCHGRLITLQSHQSVHIEAYALHVCSPTAYLLWPGKKADSHYTWQVAPHLNACLLLGRVAA